MEGIVLNGWPWKLSLMKYLSKDLKCVCQPCRCLEELPSRENSKDTVGTHVCVAEAEREREIIEQSVLSMIQELHHHQCVSHFKHFGFYTSIIRSH